MAVVVWQEAALRDIDRLSSYVASVNPAAARRIARSLREAGDSLQLFPGRGRPGIVAGTRELVVRERYIIGYVVEGDAVRIIRVWHHAQQRTPS